MGETIYRRLMHRATGDRFDAHCLACVIAARWSDTEGTLPQRLGLSEADFRDLVAFHFGGAALDPLAPDGAIPDSEPEPAPEEDDLHRLFLDHRARGTRTEAWLAAIVTHTALRANHLWQDLGLSSREDVSLLLHRHFPGLARRNATDMKWKKFFYKQLCEQEDIRVCTAPNCEVCSDFHACFGPEDGLPLLRLAPGGDTRGGIGDRG